MFCFPVHADGGWASDSRAWIPARRTGDGGGGGGDDGGHQEEGADERVSQSLGQTLFYWGGIVKVKTLSHVETNGTSVLHLTYSTYHRELSSFVLSLRTQNSHTILLHSGREKSEGLENGKAWQHCKKKPCPYFLFFPTDQIPGLIYGLTIYKKQAKTLSISNRSYIVLRMYYHMITKNKYRFFC